MTNSQIRSHWIQHLESRNFAEGTIKSYREKVVELEGTLGKKSFTEVTQQDFVRHLKRLNMRLKDNTILTHIMTLKSFYRWLYESGRTHQNLGKLIPKQRSPRRVLKKVLTISQIKKILKAPDLNKPLGYRDRTMLIVTYAGALRVKELMSLEVQNVNETKQTIIVTRKGGDQQELPIGGLAMEYLSTYISEIRPMFSLRSSSTFITARGKSMIESHIYQTFKHHFRSVGLGDFSPHDLRHAAATHLMQLGAEFRVIQQFLGHKSADSTAVYTKVRNSEIRGMVDRIGG